jgi:hypothetical protein
VELISRPLFEHPEPPFPRVWPLCVRRRFALMLAGGVVMSTGREGICVKSSPCSCCVRPDVVVRELSDSFLYAGRPTLSGRPRISRVTSMVSCRALPSRTITICAGVKRSRLKVAVPDPLERAVAEVGRRLRNCFPTYGRMMARCGKSCRARTFLGRACSHRNIEYSRARP